MPPQHEGAGDGVSGGAGAGVSVETHAAEPSPSRIPLRTLLFSLEKSWSVAQEQALALALALHGSGRYDVRLCCPADSALAQRARQQDASLPLLSVSSPRHLPSLFRLWRCQQRKQPLLLHSFDPDALQLAERLTHVRRPGSTVLLHSCLTNPAAEGREADAASASERGTERGLVRDVPFNNMESKGGTGDKDGSATLNLGGKGSASKGWQLANKILCAHGTLRSQLADCGLDAARLCVVHPGLDAAALPRRREREDGRFVFVAVEHLQQGAGLFVLLRAMAALWQRTDLPPWEVRVVGSGRALTAILDEARSLGVEARLALLSRQDLGEVLPRCDALLVPHRQACGNTRALMAAWCCALPLVCTDMAPHEEVLRAAERACGLASDVFDGAGSARVSTPVDPGLAALSVPSGEAQVLAAAMIRLLTEPDLCAQLAARGASLSEYADHARMVAQTLRQYEDCLSRQGWVLPPLQTPAPASADAPPEFPSPKDPDAE